MVAAPPEGDNGPRVEFLLELQVPPHGYPAGTIAVASGGEAHTFHGWLELMMLLEELAAMDQPPARGTGGEWA